MVGDPNLWDNRGGLVKVFRCAKSSSVIVFRGILFALKEGSNLNTVKYTLDEFVHDMEGLVAAVAESNIMLDTGGQDPSQTPIRRRRAY